MNQFLSFSSSIPSPSMSSAIKLSPFWNCTLPSRPQFQVLLLLCCNDSPICYSSCQCDFLLFFFFDCIQNFRSFFFLLVCANLRLKGINDFSHMMNDDVLIPNYIAKLNNTHLHQSLHRRPCLSNNSSNVSSLTP